MKAIAISGSPRKGGNTDILLRRCLEHLGAAGIKTEFVTLRDKAIRGCIACGVCGKVKNKLCALEDDLNSVLTKVFAADIIILGSPVYFGSATSEIKALIDRVGYVSKSNGDLLSRKIGGPIAVARRAGQNFTYAQLAYWYTINDMILVGSSYWNVAVGRAEGDVLSDEEGLATIDRFAENLIWLGKKLA
ncbi:MAG: flavodoxin family protein [Phycisphaerae bacterium]|nr:flavodoxin family protein [Phycisphaerae bacterium]